MNWLSEFDDSQIEEGERLNVLLTVAKWEVDHERLHKPVEDELYLYYKQLVKGELDDVIDPEEREDVERVLQECFHKAFPEGL